jgi:UDP-N-acetylglucosamine--N-acetylmuramyl-(pentapeptide) pyrophosphoryl-undecaprenol N-acetylglucosamine transferase
VFAPVSWQLLHSPPPPLPISPSEFYMPRPPHIVFAGGGTHGQLYPGLAVAAQLAARVPHAMITFVGGGRSGDRHVIRAAGFRHAKLPSRPAPESALNAVRFVTDNVAGYLAARWYLKEKHVTAVVGLGGAASAPTVRAAISRGLPVVLLEQNVVPGRATRWLARSARSVCAGFDQTRAYFPSAVPLTITGNPARATFQQLHRKNTHQWRGGRKRLVILGGSGRISSINEHMPRALSRLRQQLSGWQIVHQAGDGHLQETERRYHDVCVNAMVFAFVDEMAPLIFGSDLVFCRGGATTLAELALAGAPAVVAPSPGAMDYQWPNAEVYASAGAATLVDETEDTAPFDDAIVDQLKSLLIDDARRERMAANMRRLARPDAAANVCDVIYDAIFGQTVRLAA